MTAEQVDVVIVGAGFSGLAAARRLTAQGHSVIVLEGRDRVGGRSWTGEIAGVPLDLGASFVGPTQDAVLALAAEMDCPTTPTFHHGKNVINWRGRTRSYRGTIPKMSPVVLADLARLRVQLDRLGRGIPVDQPWTAPDAARLDAMSLRDWMSSKRATRSTMDLMSITARVVWGADIGSISALHAALYIKAAGGLDRLLDVSGGAQQDRFLDGTQQIAQRVADELGDRVRLSRVVKQINRDERGVLVRCADAPADANTGTDADADADGHIRASTAILAIPPQHRAGIDFSPALPPEHQRLTRCWPQGRLSKAFAVYEYPFWRTDGLSGEGVSDTGPVLITFDMSPSAAGPGVLLGFVDPAHFDDEEPRVRRERTLAGFARLFGKRARHPVDYLDQRWGAEEFAPGGPTAAVPAGSWTGVGPWLRKPLGPIFWAGTETSDVWPGYLDGAVRAGHRAADEVSAWLARPV